MFNRLLPPALDRRLPVVYLVAAGLLLVSPLSRLKWIPIAALGLAALVTLLLRRAAPDESAGGELATRGAQAPSVLADRTPR